MHLYDGLTPFVGDLHSHCDVGYGHGTLDDAFANARLQLDFVAVTPHAVWHDMPVEEERLADVVAYHRAGFKRTKEQWPRVKQLVQELNEPGSFVTFLAYEWHSLAHGDHNVYFRDPGHDIVEAPSLEDLRQAVRGIRAGGGDAILIPHHIGYQRGHRGINWDDFTDEVSPVVEAMSMHGAAVSTDGPYPYLHTMGPRDARSTYQHGLSRGNLVGLIGSSDHHSAHPGSYGHGRLAVWGDSLTREGIWDGLKSRRTYALTGDRIALAFGLNDCLMGEVAPSDSHRSIDVEIEAGGAIDYVDILHNNEVVHRANGAATMSSIREDPFARPVKVHFEVGWGEVGDNVDWDVRLEVSDGELIDVEPRFRGHNVVAPQSRDEEKYSFSDMDRSDNGVTFSTRTWGNPNSVTPGTQGVGLVIKGHHGTSINAKVNGVEDKVSLGSLLDGAETGHLGRFLTPAYVFRRAIPADEYTSTVTFEHESSASRRDWYQAVVRQQNGQMAWSSPIWVEPDRRPA